MISLPLRKDNGTQLKIAFCAKRPSLCLPSRAGSPDSGAVSAVRHGCDDDRERLLVVGGGQVLRGGVVGVEYEATEAAIDGSPEDGDGVAVVEEAVHFSVAAVLA